MMRSSLILMAFLVLLVGCDVKTEKTPVAEPAATTTTQSQTSGVKKSMTNVKMETSAGTIMIEMDAEKAPLTVANIEAYIKDGFYDGLIFHRVIPNFMIQGGGFNANMTEKGDKRPPIKNEANNGLKNDRGTLAMARTNDPHSASSQFFINLKDNDFLNHTSESGSGWGYAVFGKVTEGLDVMDTIAAVKTGQNGMHGDVPLEPVMINSVTIVE